MKKDCEYYMEQFLELDKNQRIPLTISLHMLNCSKCRKEVKALSKAEKLAANPLRIKLPLEKDSISNAIMEVNPDLDPKEIKVPIFQWIISGIIMMAALVFFGIITKSADKFYSFIFYMVFAGAICAYLGAFIATNLDFFVKKIESSAKAI